MSAGVSAASSAYLPYASSAAQRAREEEAAFSVPASALRSESAAAPSSSPQARRDPAADTVELSDAYFQFLAGGSASPALQPLQTAGIPGDPGALPASPGGEQPAGAGETEGADEAEEAAASPDGQKANGEELSEEEKVQVQELAGRDREVRAHEQAHQAVGGQYAGGASYEYQMGPDGKRYAVGGEVSIDTSKEREPQATIAKMQVVQAAAMAPAQPSGQDRSVAAQAAATQAEAQGELREQQTEKAAASREGTDGAGGQENAESPESAPGADSATGGAEAGAAGESSNPLAEAFRQTRSNPYGNAPGVFNLPEAYRSINVVA